MSKEHEEKLFDALNKIAKIFDNATSSIERNEFFLSSCIHIVNEYEQILSSSYIDFYIAARCFALECYHFSLIFIIRVCRNDSNGLGNLCRAYVDYIENNNDGSPEVKYNIGILYNAPFLRKKDTIKARRLQMGLFRQKYPQAITSFAYDFLYGRDIRQDDHIAYGLFRAGEDNSLIALRGLLLCKIIGISQIDKEGLLPAYEKLARAENDWISPFIMRACLGFRGEQDLIAASTLASERARAGDHSSEMLYNSLSNPDFQAFIAGNKIALQMINDYGWNRAPEKYKIPKDNSDIRHLALLSSTLAWLSISESHSDEFAWNIISAQFGCHYWSLPFKSVLHNSLRIGRPLQKKTKRGIPIGKWRDTEPNINLQAPQNDGFSLHLKGKEIYKISGRFSEHFQIYHPSLIDHHDLMVALALAFANDRPEHPWFSIEAFGCGFVEQELIPIRNRVHAPIWLSATSIGDAIYLADAMMPTFGLGNLFSWRDFFSNAQFEKKQHNADFYQAIENAGGTTPFPMARNSINSKRVVPKTDIYKPWWYFGRHIEMYKLTQMEMYFDASYIYYNADGEKNRNAFPNDPTTKIGHRAAIGSQRYEELARAFPVFARVRLFLMLAATLASIADKERGYTVSPTLRAHLQKLRANYAKRSTNKFPIFRSYANLPRLERGQP